MWIFKMNERRLKMKEGEGLLKYGTDITGLAETGKLDPVIGREKEIGDLIEALLKRRNSNACLVGDAGVGKTAIVEALALKIAANSVPPQLRGKRVVSIELARLVDESASEFEKKVKNMLEEARPNEGSVILFIDDLHNLIKNTNTGEDGIATILKLILAADHFIKCICAIRVDEYTRYIERDGALKSMFETIIQLREPSRQDCIKMLHGIFHKYEDHHGVHYTPTALVSAVDLSKHYMRGVLLLPGKAINLIDKAGARTQMLGQTYVTEAEIEHVVSTSTQIPFKEFRLQTDLEEIFKSSLIGQDEAVAAVCGCIRRARVRIRDKETKPIACFMFTGPTGVGKTEMAKVLAKDYFGDEAAMLCFDSRKFMEFQSVSQLILQLTEEVWRRPQSLVLFDEIEKAHEQVVNVLLQILDGGRLSDGKGKIVGFNNTIVILTSNSSDVFKPELHNRFDKVVVFKPLEKEHIDKILEMMIKQFCARVAAKKKIQVEFSKRLKEWLILVGYDKSYGARALKRAFANSIETKLADEILCGRVVSSDTVMFDVALTGDVECQAVSLVMLDVALTGDAECQAISEVMPDVALTRDVECWAVSLSHVKIHQKCPHSDSHLPRITSHAHSHLQYVKHENWGVDSELTLPLLGHSKG